jgi:cold shock CspA family protein
MSSTGIFKKFHNEAKSCGWITPDDGSACVFCHENECTNLAECQPGDAVKYDRAWDDRKRKCNAINFSMSDGGGGDGGGGGGGGGGDGQDRGGGGGEEEDEEEDDEADVEEDHEQHYVLVHCTGTTRQFFEEEGFDLSPQMSRQVFITPDAGGQLWPEDVFACVSECPELTAARPGDRCHYDIMWDARVGAAVQFNRMCMAINVSTRPTCHYF